MINENELQETRVLDESAEKLLYYVKISGASAHQEHAKIVSRARLSLQKKYVRFLIHEDEIIDELNKRYNYMVLKSSSNEQDNEKAQRIIYPFKQTTRLIDEGINTTVIDRKGGGIEINEKGGNRKDRIMSFLYGLLYIDILEGELQYTKEDGNYMDKLEAYLGFN